MIPMLVKFLAILVMLGAMFAQLLPAKADGVTIRLGDVEIRFDNDRDRGYRPRPRYYGNGYYQPRPRYYGNDYYQPRRYDRQRQFQVRPCPNLGHYQGRIVYRNGCYYPG